MDEEATDDLVSFARGILREHDDAGAAERLARLAGARVRGGVARFAFWLPREGRGDDEDEVLLELLTLPGGTWLGAERVDGVRRDVLPMRREGDWAFLAVHGVAIGTREQGGTLYRASTRGAGGERRVWTDPMASSLPFGAGGPAELYHVGRMHLDRDDADYFLRVGLASEDPEEGPARLGPPAHVLQLHVGTATHGGTIADLADLYRALSDKVRRGEDPTPAESAFLGYDAVQLMPLEPQAADPYAPPGFELHGDGERAVATLRPPATVGWGYDPALVGGAAIEPSLLRSGRPDELVDLASVLHGFPGKPILLILDLVLAHAHPQARSLLPGAWFRSEGGYGPLPDLTRPAVRALLLEMQRRKAGFGVDGLRIDASHEFVVPVGDVVEEVDDAFLASLDAVVAEVGEARYRPFMIFEDGRRSGRGATAAAADYRGVVDRLSQAFQWGPLTFADTEPFLEGYWASVGWRLEQIARGGARWIQGYANHDTVRRAHWMRPAGRWNPRLGNDRPTMLRRAYDHPAADLTFYGFLPGVPMSFLAATTGAPWGFFRDSDGADAIRVAAEEAGLLAWRVAAEDYGAPDLFVRCKRAGLHDHGTATAVWTGLRDLAAATPDAMVARASERGLPLPEGIDGAGLVALARDFLRDLRDLCVVWRWEHGLDPSRMRALRGLRQVRRERPWLRSELRERDLWDRKVHASGGVLCYGVRHAPDGSESVALLANLEGEPWTVVPSELLGEADWRPLAVAPERDWHGAGAELTLHDAEAILLHR